MVLIVLWLNIGWVIYAAKRKDSVYSFRGRESSVGASGARLPNNLCDLDFLQLGKDPLSMVTDQEEARPTLSEEHEIESRNGDAVSKGEDET